jgi:hypothetical protein
MSVHGDLDDAIRRLDDCERAIKKGDMTRALREIRDAIRKLKDLDSPIKRLEREAK